MANIVKVGQGTKVIYDGGSERIWPFNTVTLTYSGDKVLVENVNTQQVLATLPFADIIDKHGATTPSELIDYYAANLFFLNSSGGGGSVATLNNIGDVVYGSPGPAAGQFLKWNGSEWTPGGGDGTGTLSTIKADNVQIGGSDIVTLDFGPEFSLNEAPDTEINISANFGTLAGTFAEGSHIHIAADVGYTPIIIGDWDVTGGPTDVKQGLDELAGRLGVIEGGGGVNTDGQEINATDPHMTDSETFVDMPSMTLTTSNTGSRKYLVFLSVQLSVGTGNKEVYLQLVIDGVIQTSSIRTHSISSANAETVMGVHVLTDSLPTGKIIKAQWHSHVQGPSVTTTVTARTLTIYSIENS